ncbi:DUF881 domain-containing protein [Savagea sp. SN6]|uniref:DUF881 domain-containing protein n=1 Tax=Savagea serpentis TaxID=2785297 RepID=A0A8J7GHP0_9BACL|nr:DUF881 domain-containing protein [Savagea serpentis]
MNSQNKRKSKKNSVRQIWFSVVFLVLGFIFAFSYKTLGINNQQDNYQPLAYLREEQYREELLRLQERNKELYEELDEKMREVMDIEHSFMHEEDRHTKLIEEAEQLRLLLGLVPAHGEGVKVTLKDADYDPLTQNPNDYIVHESHVLRVVNELKIAGAEGIAINGQRLTSNSSIKCTGPVITVDGKTFPEPFVIEAVGSQEVLQSSLQLRGGVLDSLEQDHIVVLVEEKEVILPALREG